MIALRRHSSQDYAAFPDIDAPNIGTLTEEDRTCLDEVGDFLLQAKSHHRFGVALLHSHFPIENDETLVEEVQTEAKLITLRPASDERSGLGATSVCFDDVDTPSGECRLVGLEFASGQELAGVSPIDDQDRDVLIGIGRILHHRSKSRRFGVRLLHDPLKLNGRVLFETCDLNNRVLTCRSIADDDPKVAQSIPTVFRWQEPRARMEDRLAVDQKCITVSRCTRPRRVVMWTKAITRPFKARLRLILSSKRPQKKCLSGMEAPFRRKDNPCTGGGVNAAAGCDNHLFSKVQGFECRSCILTRIGRA